MMPLTSIDLEGSKHWVSWWQRRLSWMGAETGICATLIPWTSWYKLFTCKICGQKPKDSSRNFLRFPLPTPIFVHAWLIRRTMEYTYNSGFILNILYLWIIFWYFVIQNQRNTAMLIREPKLAYNTKNKRKPRGGRQYCETCNGGPDVFTDPNSIKSLRQLRKRSAEDEDEGEDLKTEENDAAHSKRHWVIGSTSSMALLIRLLLSVLTLRSSFIVCSTKSIDIEKGT